MARLYRTRYEKTPMSNSPNQQRRLHRPRTNQRRLNNAPKRKIKWTTGAVETDTGIRYRILDKLGEDDRDDLTYFRGDTLSGYT
jgi:hypothetical protein